MLNVETLPAHRVLRAAPHCYYREGRSFVRTVATMAVVCGAVFAARGCLFRSLVPSTVRAGHHSGKGTQSCCVKTWSSPRQPNVRTCILLTPQPSILTCRCACVLPRVVRSRCKCSPASATRLSPPSRPMRKGDRGVSARKHGFVAGSGLRTATKTRLSIQGTCQSTCGLVAMTSASHAEGRQFDPGQVYFFHSSPQCCWRLQNDSCGVRTHALADWRLEPPP